ncbi:MAG: hypothetical protein ACRC8S_15625 [Fimbriiglobus sp.]
MHDIYSILRNLKYGITVPEEDIGSALGIALNSTFTNDIDTAICIAYEFDRLDLVHEFICKTLKAEPFDPHHLGIAARSINAQLLRSYPDLWAPFMILLLSKDSFINRCALYSLSEFISDVEIPFTGIEFLLQNIFDRGDYDSQKYSLECIEKLRAKASSNSK